MEASNLTRQHDLKLLFDVLVDDSGSVPVSAISERWPTQADRTGTLPPNLLNFWTSETSTTDGRLSWRRFHRGVENALMTLAKEKSSKDKKGTEAQWMVSSKEMEKFLRSCSQESVSQALIRSRKEMYKCHKSLANLASPRRDDSGERMFSPEAGDTKCSPKRSASFTAGERPQSMTSSPVPGHIEVTAALEVVRQVEKLLREQLIGKVKLAIEANQILQAALHLQNVLVAPPTRSNNQATHVEAHVTTGKQSKALNVGATRPVSMILPNKAQTPVISSRTFSPKRENSQRLQVPVRVDRSVSQPGVAYMQAPPSSPLLQSSSTKPPSTLTTDYPRMRAASSMTNLPTDARSDPRTTRAMLEAWKNSKVEAKKAEGSSSNLQTPLQHSSPRPSGPRAVVEIPSQLPPKHQSGRQYMSSPDIHRDTSDQSRNHVISEQSAEIQRLRSEKEALIRHLFQNQGRHNSTIGQKSALV